MLKIAQYTPEGHFLRHWKDVEEILGFYGNKWSRVIPRALEGKMHVAAFHMWRYSNSKKDIPGVNPHKISAKVLHRKVAQIDKLTGRTIRVWPNITLAAKMLGLHQSNISNVCRGVKPLCGDCKWEYAGPLCPALARGILTRKNEDVQEV